MYKIVKSDSVSGLEEKVNEALKDGFRPVGGLVVSTGFGDNIGKMTIFMQAVVRGL